MIDTENPGQQDFASGLLAGAGLREISQVLGLSKKKKAAGAAQDAQPTAATMLSGELGDVDKMMLMSKMQAAMAGPGGGMPMPGGPPMGDPTMGPPPMPPMGPLAPPVPMAAPPLGGGMVPPGMPPPMIGAPPIGAGPQPGAPGGGLPMMLLQQLLSGSQGIV